MTRRTFGEEFSRELASKAVIWGPAVAGAAVAGPVGLLLGAVVAVAIVVSGDSGSPPPDSGDPPKD